MNPKHPLSRLRFPRWGLLLPLLAALAFFACQGDEPEEAVEIQWNLSDSLSRYERVVIHIFSADSTQMDTLHDGKLDKPADFNAKPYKVPARFGKDFKVVVQAFAGGTLILETKTPIAGGKSGTPDKAGPAPVVVEGTALTALAVSAGTLTPAFDPKTLAYSLTVPYAADSLGLDARAADSTDTVKVAGILHRFGQALRPFPIRVGSNAFEIKVISEDGEETRVYTVTVTRQAAAVSLAGLVVVGGPAAPALSPAFHPDTLDYKFALPSLLDSVAFIPVGSNPLFEIRLDTHKVVSGALTPLVGLLPGKTATWTFRVQVPGDTAAKREYRIAVSRGLSPDASLKDLQVKGGILAPLFHPDSLEYRITMASAATEITATPKEGASTLKIGDQDLLAGKASDALSLLQGENKFEVKVTAPNKVGSKTYTVRVFRPAESVYLKELAVEGAALLPAFSPTGFAYAVSVPRATASVKVSFKAADTSSTLSFNGTQILKGTTSVNAPLLVGINYFQVTVTGSDKVTKAVYNLAVARQPNTDAALKLLTLNGLAPRGGFTAADTLYGDTLDNGMVLPGIKAEANDTAARLVLRHYLYIWNSRGTALEKKALSKTAAPIIGPIKPGDITTPISIGRFVLQRTDTVKSSKLDLKVSLPAGSNLVEIEVLAEDGKTRRTYSLNLFRKYSSNAFLSSLKLFSGTSLIGPADTTFRSTLFVYNLSTFSSFVQVVPKAQDTTATILLNGKAVASNATSESLNLVTGANTLKVSVTAQDGTTKREYVLNVTRNVLLNPVFTPVREAEPIRQFGVVPASW